MHLPRARCSTVDGRFYQLVLEQISRNEKFTLYSTAECRPNMIADFTGTTKFLIIIYNMGQQLLSKIMMPLMALHTHSYQQ